MLLVLDWSGFFWGGWWSACSVLTGFHVYLLLCIDTHLVFRQRRIVVMLLKSLYLSFTPLERHPSQTIPFWVYEGLELEFSRHTFQSIPVEMWVSLALSFLCFFPLFSSFWQLGVPEGHLGKWFRRKKNWGSVSNQEGWWWQKQWMDISFLIQPIDLYHPGTPRSGFRERWNLSVHGSTGQASVLLWHEKDKVGQLLNTLNIESGPPTPPPPAAVLLGA